MDLYALPPEEFTAARDAAVKAAKADKDAARAKELAALRRPTVSAHAVNALVRVEPDLLAQLLDLGQALAQAQQDGAGDELKALGAQRRQLVEAVADQAGAASGKKLAAAARDEVVSTLEAALADSASAAAVRTGRLVRALSYAGFGGVDLDGAVAPESPAPEPASKTKKSRTEADRAAEKRAEAQAKAVKAAERASQQAHGALDDVVRAHEQAVRLGEQAATTLETADAAVARAQEALTAAEERQREARKGQEQAADELDRSSKAVEKAQDVAETARMALDELRRS